MGNVVKRRHIISILVLITLLALVNVIETIAVTSSGDSNPDPEIDEWEVHDWGYCIIFSWGVKAYICAVEEGNDDSYDFHDWDTGVWACYGIAVVDEGNQGHYMGTTLAYSWRSAKFRNVALGNEWWAYAKAITKATYD
ncbi:MAG: hypothetical protein NDF55_08685 [archaeon GB-1867-005]|nr:hypothetical protein [Candidatus Culexmicrobium cathedralense]